MNPHSPFVAAPANDEQAAEGRIFPAEPGIYAVVVIAHRDEEPVVRSFTVPIIAWRLRLAPGAHILYVADPVVPAAFTAGSVGMHLPDGEIADCRTGEVYETQEEFVEAASFECTLCWHNAKLAAP